mmetsp:Transcript_8695/g.13818  ORF Transcript_8695/g.13818 Transcript_8695/m.13818 type:complete len:266 (-) Transcript_8695:592-1389(-)
MGKGASESELMSLLARLLEPSAELLLDLFLLPRLLGRLLPLSTGGPLCGVPRLFGVPRRGLAPSGPKKSVTPAPSRGPNRALAVSPLLACSPRGPGGAETCRLGSSACGMGATPSFSFGIMSPVPPPSTSVASTLPAWPSGRSFGEGTDGSFAGGGDTRPSSVSGESASNQQASVIVRRSEPFSEDRRCEARPEGSLERRCSRVRIDKLRAASLQHSSSMASASPWMPFAARIWSPFFTWRPGFASFHSLIRPSMMDFTFKDVPS